MLPLAVQAAMAAIEKICPEAKNLLLIPEKHTRNTFYLMNVKTPDAASSTQAGLNVRLGTLDEAIKAPTKLPLPDGSELTIEPLVKRTRGRLGLKDFDPCTILLNNDLSAGVPKRAGAPARAVPAAAAACGLGGAAQVTITSRATRRWPRSSPSCSAWIPWLINPMYGPVRQGRLRSRGPAWTACRANVDALLTKVRRKYKEYGINEKPFVVVKADATAAQGMGIMTVRDAKEVDDLSQHARARLPRMDLADDGQPVPTEVIIQEGVPTYERMNDAVAEPVVYMIDRYVVGGFYRVHAERGIDENLNAPWLQLRAAGLRRKPRSCRARAPSRASAHRTASTCTA